MTFQPLKCVSCAVCSTLVIYHYCVIVEMFCIGLYARHTFRKVEPSMVEDVEGPVSGWQMEKAVQTEDVQMAHHKPSLVLDEAWPSRCLFSGSNPGYNSDSEDSLCRIEHAPLDGFPFPSATAQQPVEPRPAEETEQDLTHITVNADINYQESKDVTMV